MGGVAQLVFSGPLVLAIPVAAAAGAVSFLSPCCLPLVPGYVSYITGMSGEDLRQRAAGADQDPAGQDPAGAGVTGAGMTGAEPCSGGALPGGVAVAARAAGRARPGGLARARPPHGRPQRPGQGRTLAGAALFVLGFAALFATYGALFGGLGATLSLHQRGLAQVLGALTIVLGLLFMGVFERFSVTGRIVAPSFRPRAGLAGAPLLGVMFGLGWTPCIGPTLTAVMTMSITTGTAARGAFLAFVYALGLGIPFIVAAFAVQRGLRAFGFARRHARLITQAGGAMLVAVGILQVTGVWVNVIASLQHWISGYSLPL
jgi:cytochrome c-type biogenesis protein